MSKFQRNYDSIIASCKDDLEFNGCNCYVHALMVYNQRLKDGYSEEELESTRLLIEALGENIYKNEGDTQ